MIVVRVDDGVAGGDLMDLRLFLCELVHKPGRKKGNSWLKDENFRRNIKISEKISKKPKNSWTF